MQIRPHDLPDDVAQLKALLLKERERAQVQGEEIERYKSTVSRLEHLLHVMSKWTFGPRTEKRSTEPAPPADQGWLPFAELLEAAQRVADSQGAEGTIEVAIPAEKAPRKQSRRRKDFPDHLPRARTISARTSGPTRRRLGRGPRLACGRSSKPCGPSAR